jgi:hypothetical protein
MDRKESFKTSDKHRQLFIAIKLMVTIKFIIIIVRLATGWTAKGSEFESRWEQELSFLRVVQTGSGAHPASHSMGTGGKAARA